MIIVNGMRYRISEQILSMSIWVILHGHDMYGCISTPVNMFIFIRNCNTNWKSYTSVWQSMVHDLPYFPASVIVVTEHGLLHYYNIHIVFHASLSSSLLCLSPSLSGNIPILDISYVCHLQYVSQLSTVFWSVTPVVLREPVFSEERIVSIFRVEGKIRKSSSEETA
jgi:hypothetical protein